MKVQRISMLFLAVASSAAQSGVIGFDYSLSGYEISASPYFSQTSPSAPIPGPIVSEYRPAGVTFYGGVILNYDAFGGPTDTRTVDGSPLASAPNLLATTDFLPLSDGSQLPGRITAKFEFPVSIVSAAIRNGHQAADFTMSGYLRGNLSDSVQISLGSFLSEQQDGFLGVSDYYGFDEIRIQSSQPIGSKDFGIDRFLFVPTNSEDGVHSGFQLAAISAKQSEAAQDIASQNFLQTLEALVDLNEDGKVTGEEAFLYTYLKIDKIITAFHVLAGKATVLPFIILPCDPSLTLYGNCESSEHFQVDASLYDVMAFDIALLYEDYEGSVGQEFITSHLLDGFPTIAKTTLTNIAEVDSGFRIDYRVQTIADVTSAKVPLANVPEPSTLLLIAVGALLPLFQFGRAQVSFSYIRRSARGSPNAR